MKLVRVRGISKRTREPRILTIEECQRLLAHVCEEPFRTMVIVAIATGLRCSELLALKWCDFDWQTLTLLVRRAIVDGVVDDVKTRYSRAGLPLDASLAEILWSWKQRTSFAAEGDWVFASPFRQERCRTSPGVSSTDASGRQRQELAWAAESVGIPFATPILRCFAQMARTSKCSRNS